MLDGIRTENGLTPGDFCVEVLPLQCYKHYRVLTLNLSFYGTIRARDKEIIMIYLCY